MWHGRYDPDLTGGALAADRLHQLIGSVADVTIASRPRNLGPIPLPDEIIVTETPTATFQPNDVIVTQRSAAFYRTYGIDDWHHLNVHSEANAQTIARDARTGGIVDWRAQ